MAITESIWQLLGFRGYYGVHVALTARLPYTPRNKHVDPITITAT